MVNGKRQEVHSVAVEVLGHVRVSTEFSTGCVLMRPGGFVSNLDGVGRVKRRVAFLWRGHGDVYGNVVEVLVAVGL